MSANLIRKQSDSGRSSVRLLLSVGLPVLLLLTFVGKQIFNFDDIGWHNGFNHPLTGWDHLVTMLAVGIWAAQLRGQAIWMLPLAFVGVMSLGGLAGAAGLAIPSVEGIILLSAAVFSVLITRKIRFSTTVNVSIVAFFAFFHGFAHGQEISTSASLISYTLGFMLATLLLHGAGILLVKLVLFSVTCLLTVMFSNSALAKSAEARLIIKASNYALSGNPKYYKNLNTPRYGYSTIVAEVKGPIESDCRHEVDRTPDNIAYSTQLKPDTPSLTSARLKVTESKSNPISTALTLNKAYSITHAGFPQLTSRNTAPANSVNLDFKNYYPDINHTPGQALLSNGVGLTSPPLLHHNAFAIFPPISPGLRNISIVSPEEPPLQWDLNRFYTFASSQPRRDFIYPVPIISGKPFGPNLTQSDKPSPKINIGLTRSKTQSYQPACAITGRYIAIVPDIIRNSFEIDSRSDLAPGPADAGDIDKTHSLPSNRYDWLFCKQSRLFVAPPSKITTYFEIYA
jgi:urease accessory protein